MKIISYFPKDKQNFSFVRIYDADTHGWRLKDFRDRVRNQGATLIILRTYEGEICGGFTTKSWGNWDEYQRDADAFVFNMDKKYTPTNNDCAIHTYPGGGFRFGDEVLRLACDPLNLVDGGYCYLNKDPDYNINKDSEGKNPLTGKSVHFSCVSLEVFRILFD